MLPAITRLVSYETGDQAPLRETSEYALHSMSCNVTEDEIFRTATLYIGENWRLRERGVFETGQVSFGSRPIVLNEPPDEAIRSLFHWADTLDPTTAKRYRKRAVGQLREAKLSFSTAADAMPMALWLQFKVIDLAPASRRQYRSCAALKMIDLLSLQNNWSDLKDVLVAYLVLDAAHQTEWSDQKKPGRKGETRNWLPDDDLGAINQALTKTRSRRSVVVSSALELIKFCGARPSELKSISLSDGEGLALSYIFIDNAKFDEDGYRANGPRRILTFNTLPDSIPSAIEVVAAYSAKFETKEAWDTELGQLQRLLGQKCKALWPKQKTRRYGLYSARHQFAADMKLAYQSDPEADAIVAALMGHASDRTANKHYARASKGKVRPKNDCPSPNNLEHVRRHDGGFLKQIQHQVKPKGQGR